jgi:uncharacterized protein (DUF58 family)
MEVNAIADVVDHIQERVAAGSLEINWRSAATQAASGQRRGSRKGPGFEHHGFKEYDPADGDQAAHIDPSASAAESEDDVYIVRLYKRPRLTSLNVLVDVNPSMNMGTLSAGFKSYLAAIACGCGIKAAEKSMDRVSVVTYGDQPISIYKLKDAKAVYFQALYAAVEDRKLPSAPASSDDDVACGAEGGGLSLALEMTQRDLRSVYMVVSDFVNMNESDWDALQTCGSAHDTIAVYVQDRRERELPRVPWPGMNFALVDYRGRKASFWIAPDKSPLWFLKGLSWLFGAVTTREQYAANFKAYEDKILSRLQECGVTTVVVSTDDEDEAIQQLLQVLASKTRS